MDINLEMYRKVVWRIGGRELPYLDCYGFVLDVRRRLGLDVWPDYPEHLQKDLNQDVLKHTEGVNQSDISEGVVIACFTGRLITHLAVWVNIDGELCILECQKGVNVRRLSLSQLSRRYTKLEYYS